MIKKYISIDTIPAIMWGRESSKLFIVVHGNMSSKSDISISIFAEEATSLGYQVLSFDLPEHGDRQTEPTLCKVQNCVSDLKKVIRYARKQADSISLFANSMGAYFSLLAYQNEFLKQSIFLSPVVDMERIINNMMSWFHISPEQLEKEQVIDTPIGQTLYWDYFQYVKEHPITRWSSPTSILYGEKDTLCEYDVVYSFVRNFHCDFKVLEDAEHYFHKDEELSYYRNWLKRCIEK